MIIVRLSGGIGNQMFQYACGRAISLQLNTKLALDHSFLEDKTYKPDFTYRDYALDVFGIQNKISPSELRKLGLEMAYIYPLKAKLSLKRILKGYTYYQEKGLNYDENIPLKSAKLYLSGYFQSEKYFKQAADKIRNDFAFPPVQNERNKLLLTKITTDENSVSIHIRRGDYLTIRNGNVHFTCSPEYYKNAVDIIRSKISNPTFYIFAHDDLPWAMENLKFSEPHDFIGDHNQGKQSYEDLHLMSMCKHHIIANSSFSWWGAWLNAKPGKTVIAPKNWLIGSKDSFDIVPEQWITI